MKQFSKYFVSFLLCITLVLALFVPAFAGLDGNYTAPLPTVYLQGQGFILYADKDDTSSEMIHHVEIPDGYIGDRAKEMIGPLLKGVTLNDWDEWCDLLVDAVASLYAKQALDENGEASNGSGINTSNGKYDRKNADGSFNINAYTPNYDWRLDPCKIADEIHTYIQQIKAATNKEKVNLIGRSIGANVILAYLEKYGAEDLDTTVLYCPSFYGMEVFSRAFAGKISIDPKAIERFTDYYFNSGMADEMMDDGNEDLTALLMDFISASVQLHALDLPAGALERIYEQVYTKVYPQLLVKMYGSMPSFWSLVGDEDFEDAKALIFGGQEDTYAKLIEKIDNFHYNVLVKAEDTIKELVQSGSKIQVVVKSGVPMVPVVADAAYNSDMLTTVWSASAGATCTPLGETLPAQYQMEASRKGAWKYFSPDRDIDASTSLLPDHTWFINGLDHRSMPTGVNVLFEAMFNKNGYMNVFDNEQYPQYLDFDRETNTLSVLSKTPEEPQQSRIAAFFARIRNFFRGMITLLKNLFSIKN